MCTPPGSAGHWARVSCLVSLAHPAPGTRRVAVRGPGPAFPTFMRHTSHHGCDSCPGMFSEKDFCINCICEYYRECDGKKNIYFGNKFIWGSWLFLGKKRKIFYNCHYLANQRLMFDLNSRDGEYSKFELCSESS